MAMAGERPVTDSTLGLRVFLQELSGIRGEGGQVSALGFPEDHIEHQRRLPGTGDPGDDNQLVFGNIQRYPTEIVLRGIPYRYLIMPLHPMDLPAKIGKSSLFAVRVSYILNRVSINFLL